MNVYSIQIGHEIFEIEAPDEHVAVQQAVEKFDKEDGYEIARGGFSEDVEVTCPDGILTLWSVSGDGFNPRYVATKRETGK